MSVGDWNLVVVGISHRSSTLQQREPLQIGREETAHANSILNALPAVKESLVLATCNRVELYFVTDRGSEPFDIARLFFRQLKDKDISDLRGHFYIKKNRHAADHLFRVTAGIDSMVIGENQIVQQVKEAYTSACALKAADKVIHRTLHQAFRVGKEVRTDTEMGKGACSVSSAAMELLNTRVSAENSPMVLFVGLNQMIALAASNLAKHGHTRFAFANRTAQKAAEFGSKYGAAGYGLDCLDEMLGETDVVITCTSSPTAIISRDMVARAVHARPDRRMVIIDLAIPRDVDCVDGDLSGVEVHDLEAIKQFVRDQQKKREAAIPMAEEIIDRRLSEFVYWFEHIRYEPIYNGLGNSFEAIRQQELATLMEKLPPELQGEVEQTTRRLVDHLLHLKQRTTKPSH